MQSIINKLSLLVVLIFIFSPSLSFAKYDLDEISTAVNVILMNDGIHVSPLPMKEKSAFDLLSIYDEPKEGVGKSYTDGSSSKVYYFQKCNITWYFRQDIKGHGEHKFFITDIKLPSCSNSIALFRHKLTQGTAMDKQHAISAFMDDPMNMIGFAPDVIEAILDDTVSPRDGDTGWARTHHQAATAMGMFAKEYDEKFQKEPRCLKKYTFFNGGRKAEQKCLDKYSFFNDGGVGTQVRREYVHKNWLEWWNKKHSYQKNAPVVLELNYTGNIKNWDASLRVEGSHLNIVNAAFITVLDANNIEIPTNKNVSKSWVDSILNEPFNIRVDISRFYDLSKMGKYTIRWGCLDIKEYEIQIEIVE